MVRSLLLAIGLMFGGCAFAQVDEQKPPDIVCDMPGLVQEMPEFPGGPQAMAEFMVKEVKYPKKAKREGIQGQVVVGFVVDKDGSVTDVQVVKGVDPLLDAEAVRAVQAMPKWTPGKQNGKPVKTKFNLPVRFKLKD